MGDKQTGSRHFHALVHKHLALPRNKLRLNTTLIVDHLHVTCLNSPLEPFPLTCNFVNAFIPFSYFCTLDCANDILRNQVERWALNSTHDASLRMQITGY